MVTGHIDNLKRSPFGLATILVYFGTLLFIILGPNSILLLSLWPNCTKQHDWRFLDMWFGILEVFALIVVCYLVFR